MNQGLWAEEILCGHVTHNVTRSSAFSLYIELRPEKNTPKVYELLHIVVREGFN